MESPCTAPVVTGTVVFTIGDDVSTDAIYPGRFMATVLPAETPQFAFADNMEFNSRLKKKEITAGSVIVAGANFGCGSSREQAASYWLNPGWQSLETIATRRRGTGQAIQTCRCP